MATLAEQLESALEGTGSAMSASNIEDMLSGTATSITPGTVTPVSPQQSNQQSWNQVFSKIGEGVALKPGEGLPEVPKNIPASTFYRTATQAGKLPSGGAQFFTKPLAPETKPWKLTDTPATTPSTTSATTSQQNVIKQIREAVELDTVQDDSGDTRFGGETFSLADRSFSSIGVEGYFPSLEDGSIEQPNIDIGDVFSNPQLADNYLAQQGREVVNFIENIPEKAEEWWQEKMDNKGRELTKLGFAAVLPRPMSFLATPLIEAIFSEGNGQLGTEGIVMNDYWNNDTFGTTTSSAVHGFANVPGYAFSVAVDKNGNVLGSPYGPVQGVVMYGGKTDAGQAAYDKGQANKARDEYEAANPYGSVDDQTADARTSSTRNIEDAIAGYQGQSDHVETAESGDPTGDKIICTMMNRMYGLGEYRIKQWLLYSKRYLKEEHQLGYHKLYCNLVAKMPTNRILAKILSHLADKRTDDIVAEMKGTERSWLGRFYRTTLIDGPSYIVGTMIKNNWLKPVDISILQEG